MKLMICALMFMLSTSAFATRMLLSNDTGYNLSITKVHISADGNSGMQETFLSPGMNNWVQAPDNLFETKFKIVFHVNGHVLGISVAEYNWIQQNPNSELMNFRFYLRGDKVDFNVIPVR